MYGHESKQKYIQARVLEILLLFFAVMVMKLPKELPMDLRVSISQYYKSKLGK